MLPCPVMRKLIKPASAAYGAIAGPNISTDIILAAIGVLADIKGITAVIRIASRNFNINVYLIGSGRVDRHHNRKHSDEEEKIILFCIDNIPLME